ncbi:hypothetical protein ES708_30920 [subsurface metagenome]
MPALLKGMILILFLLPRAFPQQPVFINLMLMFNKIGLTGTVFGVILVHLVVGLVFEKIMADKDKKEGDVDVVMIHQIFLKWAMEEDLLLGYAKDIDTWQYITSPFAKKSLGVDVEGYCMPMFHSQAVIAFNPKYVTDPPKTYEEIVKWAEEHPGKFVGFIGRQENMKSMQLLDLLMKPKLLPGKNQLKS